MLVVPGALQKQFVGYLSEKGVPSSQHGNCLKWLRYYLDFCHKYRLVENRPESLAPFVTKLQDKRQSAVQVEQACKAIKLFFQLGGSDSYQVAIETAQPAGRYGEHGTGSLENIGDQTLDHEKTAVELQIVSSVT